VRPVCRRCLVLVSVAVLSSLLAGTASARVPKFKPFTIVPGASVGGVKVGMTKKQAVKHWGKPDRCQPDANATWCQYVARSHLPGFVTPPQPYAGFYLRSGKVISIEVEFGENKAVDPTMKRLKTSKKIRLGSKMSAARHAYKLPPPSGGEAGLSRALLKKHGRCTMFYGPTAPYTKVEAIQVGLCSSNVGLLIGVQ
jgi:hypothetical protein